MPLVCPSCDLRVSADSVARFELCPNCKAAGRDVYLVEPRAPRSRRTDLIGLLATARGELARRRDRP